MTESKIVLPQTTEELRKSIKLAIERYNSSPVANNNKLNEALASSLDFKNYNQLAPLIKEENKPKKTPYEIEENHPDYTINNVEINSEIFDNELTNYTIADREDRIYWISIYYGEALMNNDPRGDAQYMKDDLNYLESCDDVFVLEKLGTNTFVAASKEPELFNDLCDDIISVNKEYNKK